LIETASAFGFQLIEKCKDKKKIIKLKDMVNDKIIEVKLLGYHSNEET